MSQTTVTQDPIGSSTPQPPQRPQRSFVVTWLFAWLLGGFAADRFYLGKIGTAVLKLVTFGGLGIWILIDLIIVLAGKTTDKQGRPLTGYDEKKVLAWIITGIFVVLGGISGVVGAATAAATLAAISQPVVAEQSDAAAEPDDAPAAPADDASAATPTDVVAWADEKYGTFETGSQNGTGDAVITLPAGATAGLVRATHQGSANFSVQVLDAQNQPTLDLLVNTIGAYNGITAYGLGGDASTPAVALQVTADGAWTLDVGPISYATEFAGAGTDDDVFLYTGDATTLEFTHDGVSAFTVVEYTDVDYDFGVGIGLLVAESGAYTGSVPVSAGPSVITVGADGGWTATEG